ncbi:MAG TPA: DUF6265 family protein [Cyclobacteriaceae bacterium]|jgi:hypothetical protein|nr:hypothetical protein [Cytophagales bacterium]HRE66135.1 DUF6265 family protein [Cyclobacteriaceae bacterium]HRF32174.1 DUF6265 family protein [Cyclobacteriaceae bacterium]
MRICIVLIAFIYGFEASAQSANDLFWLTGMWNRTNVKPGRTAHERWIKTNEGLQGWGISMNGADTSFVEKLRIVTKDNKLYYVADVPENKESTYFLITGVTATSFICENPEHDFPKKIVYQHEGNTMKATVSGNGKSIDYFFERK